MPFPYFTISILPSEIQCRSVHGRMPRKPAAATTFRSSSEATMTSSNATIPWTRQTRVGARALSLRALAHPASDRPPVRRIHPWSRSSVSEGHPVSWSPAHGIIARCSPASRLFASLRPACSVRAAALTPAPRRASVGLLRRRPRDLISTHANCKCFLARSVRAGLCHVDVALCCASGRCVGASERLSRAYTARSNGTCGRASRARGPGTGPGAPSDVRLVE